MTGLRVLPIALPLVSILALTMTLIRSAHNDADLGISQTWEIDAPPTAVKGSHPADRA